MHDFLDDLASGRLFLSLARPSIPVGGPALHAFHVDAVVELGNNFLELGEEELDEGVRVDVFLVRKVVLDPTQPLTDSNKVVGSIIFGVGQRVQEVVHFLLNGLAGGQFI